jgi:hypothetical protein
MVVMRGTLRLCLALRILEILLNRGKILLRRRHIPGLQGLRQLIEGLRDWIIAGTCAGVRCTVRVRGSCGA